MTKGSRQKRKQIFYSQADRKGEGGGGGVSYPGSQKCPLLSKMAVPVPRTKINDLYYCPNIALETTFDHCGVEKDTGRFHGTEALVGSLAFFHFATEKGGRAVKKATLS